jgi:hypothetical protein
MALDQREPVIYMNFVLMRPNESYMSVHVA